MELGRRPTASASPVRRELRQLGAHGEGWVGIQTALAIVVLVSSALDPARWSGIAAAASWAAGIVLCIAAVALFAWGAVTLGPSFSIWVTPRPGARLVDSGPYAWTRHPICTAQAVFGFGWALLWASPIGLVLAVAYAVYLDRAKLRREEETLLATYPAYDSYVRSVRHRMWPVPPRRSRGPEHRS